MCDDLPPTAVDSLFTSEYGIAEIRLGYLDALEADDKPGAFTILRDGFNRAAEGWLVADAENVQRFRRSLNRYRASWDSGADTRSVERAVLPMSDPEDGYFVGDSVRVVEGDPVQEAAVICLTSKETIRFHNYAFAASREEAARTALANLARWQAFNEHGLTPYPWELLVNDHVFHWLGTGSPLNPPRAQVIFGRPINGVSFEDVFESTSEVFAAELFGLVYYFPGRRGFISVSGIWTPIDGADDHWGIAARLGSWIEVGYLPWGAEPDRGFIAVDLLDLSGVIPGPLRDRLRTAAGWIWP